MQFVCNFGITDLSPLKEYKREYQLWAGMIRRAYDKNLHERLPTYTDCLVANEFRRFSSFNEWCQNQRGFGIDDWQLDKDILQKGNREYHPDKCVFLPREVNAFLRTRKKSRGAHPIGVTTNSKIDGFLAFLKKDKKKVYLGTFPTPELAFQAYKAAKEQAIKDMANKWKYQIDPRAYDALMAYQVEITD